MLTRYYIVIAGSVAVFLYKEQVQLEREKEEYKEKREAGLSTTSLFSSMGIGKQSDCLLTENHLKKYPYMVEKGKEYNGISRYIYRASLYRGVRFGELGIVNKVLRSATIIANVIGNDCRKTVIWPIWMPKKPVSWY